MLSARQCRFNFQTARKPIEFIPGWSAGPDLRCAIAHRGISRFRVRCGACHRAALRADPLASPRNDDAIQCDRIFDRNFCARSLRGLPKNSVLGASSTISPLSMKITRCATLLAKPISWVTTIMVMPSRARSTMTSSTSLIISGSSAEVGSSNSMAIGSIARARAMATRCCWPPDNSAGYLRAWSFSPTRSSSCEPLASASWCERPSTFSWARQRFSMILRCGNSSKCWNTMPTRARSFGRSVLGSLTLMPSTMICPLWNGSSALTHLINVDFPEPDGPHTTTTSPLATLVVQSFSAWNAGPYHLSTWLISIMGFSLMDEGDARLKTAHTERGETGNDEVDQRREQIHFDQPPVALRDIAGGAEEIRDRQHVDQGSVLEQHDGLGQQHRQHVPECLRQHDITHGLAVGQAERLGGGRLSLRDRLDAGAHDFGKIRRLEHDEGDERCLLYTSPS